MPRGEAIANKASIVLFSDSLDRACAAFTIANTAAASGMEVSLFFSCWGVNLVRKKGAPPRERGLWPRLIRLLSPIGAHRLGPSRFNFWGLGGWLIRRRMRAQNIQSIPEMMTDAKELGVKFLVCENPIALMGLSREELIPEVDDIVGAASYIQDSSGAEITLFI